MNSRSAKWRPASTWRPALAGLVAGLVAVLVAIAIVGLSAQGGPVATSSVPARIGGFSSAANTAELALERTFKASLSATEAEADFDVLTKEPHHVGSPYDITLADEIANRFTSFGLDVSRYEYSVLVPWPTERRVDIVAPDSIRLDVDEEQLPGDVWAAKPGILPAYNAYSPSGDVTGDIVYVNYGVPADYDTLQQARHQRRRQDRARAVRRQLARHQAESRRRARRDRLPHLLRSARRRIFSRGRVSGRSVPRPWDDPARQRDGHAASFRRSVDARPAVEAGCRAPAARSNRHARENSRAADGGRARRLNC